MTTDSSDRAERSTLQRFTRLYFENVPADELPAQPLARAVAAAHFEFARRWRRGPFAFRIFRPNQAQHGYELDRTVIEVVTHNRPFLVDSLTMTLERHGFTSFLVVHPVIEVRRDAQRRIQQVVKQRVGSAATDGETSFIHIEIDGLAHDADLDALRDALLRSLNDVVLAVKDWGGMCARIEGEIGRLQESKLPVGAERAEEAVAYLEWLLADNFTVLGLREYELVEDRADRYLKVIPGSGLGILRERADTRVSRSFAETPADLRRTVPTEGPVILAKSNSRSTVHRPDYLDYVGVIRYDADGRVVGELRILGLLTSTAFLASPRTVPIVRRKVAAVVERLGLDPQGHDGMALLHILETYPRTELFEANERDIARTAHGILDLEDRRRLQLFIRPDQFGRYYACQVFVPRDNFDTAVRLKIEEILLDALAGDQLDFTVSLTEAPMARLYCIVRTRERGRRRLGVAGIERRIAEAVRPWSSRLQEALASHHGADAARDLYRRYSHAFPAGYRERYEATEVLTDLPQIEAAVAHDELRTTIEAGAGAGELVFRLYSPRHNVPLSAVMPVLENIGIFVHLERPFEVTPLGGACVWMQSYECTVNGGLDHPVATLRPLVQELFAAVWAGDAENDRLNSLVLREAMPLADIVVLRAYVRYLRQAESPFGAGYLGDVLVANGAVSSLLAALFNARFGLDRGGAKRREESLVAAIEERLEAVAVLDEDRILRSLLSLVRATVRTNHFQRDAAGRPRPCLALKLLSKELSLLPEPKPEREIFVYSPRVEGVHLRTGAVSRGGLRWSDRREDFRTEILGLMKAQTVKNAVIVPVGAKGGFVVKEAAATDRAARAAQGVRCYKAFVRGLLDLTDNLVDGAVVPPRRTVRHDADDPYLVVAADKGTATFSDTANALAAEYDFWLGDAFASGGSNGYDHKKMGITARGAWESVQHHFEILGVDVARDPFTVVGIGDMAGDVFGNGMLLSQEIRLLAAFNHRHIFIDPTPDAAASFKERERLFRTAGTTWDDYARAKISTGGGVYPRSAKSIALSAQARAALGADAERLTPDELIQLILRAPVDLLWNGGIGTYVKAATERHEEVGDRGNDRVRVDADTLRCRVIGEGGNLGLTQAGRIAFAAAGGLVNADWIDNSGGVDCSDHEVNIKILLNPLVAAGSLPLTDRNALLRRMRNAVSRKVLDNNRLQARAITAGQHQSERALDWYGHVIESLQRTMELDLRREQLPGVSMLAQRREQGRGLTRPELSTLIAWSKIAVDQVLLESALVDDKDLGSVVVDYFPEPLRERFREAIDGHPLHREIVANRLSGSVVNRMGLTFTLRMAEATGSGVADVVRAFIVARDSLGVEPLWAAMDKLGAAVPFALQLRLQEQVTRSVERASRWLLLHAEDGAAPLPDTIARYRNACDALREDAADWTAQATRDALKAQRQTFVDAGVPRRLAAAVVALAYLDQAFEYCRIAERSGATLRRVAACAGDLDDQFSIARLHDMAGALTAPDVWSDRARGEIQANIDAFHGNLTLAALAAGGIRNWRKNQHDAVERMRAVVATVGEAEPPTLSRMLVVTNQLRSLSQAG